MIRCAARKIKKKLIKLVTYIGRWWNWGAGGGEQDFSSANFSYSSLNHVNGSLKIKTNYNKLN